MKSDSGKAADESSQGSETPESETPQTAEESTAEEKESAEHSESHDAGTEQGAVGDSVKDAEGGPSGQNEEDSTSDIEEHSEGGDAEQPQLAEGKEANSQEVAPQQGDEASSELGENVSEESNPQDDKSSQTSDGEGTTEQTAEADSLSQGYETAIDGGTETGAIEATGEEQRDALDKDLGNRHLSEQETGESAEVRDSGEVQNSGNDIPIDTVHDEPENLQSGDTWTMDGRDVAERGIDTDVEQGIEDGTQKPATSPEATGEVPADSNRHDVQNSSLEDSNNGEELEREERGVVRMEVSSSQLDGFDNTIRGDHNPEGLKEGGEATQPTEALDTMQGANQATPGGEVSRGAKKGEVLDDWLHSAGVIEGRVGEDDERGLESGKSNENGSSEKNLEHAEKERSEELVGGTSDGDAPKKHLLESNSGEDQSVEASTNNGVELSEKQQNARSRPDTENDIAESSQSANAEEVQLGKRRGVSQLDGRTGDPSDQQLDQPQTVAAGSHRDGARYERETRTKATANESLQNNDGRDQLTVAQLVRGAKSDIPRHYSSTDESGILSPSGSRSRSNCDSSPSKSNRTGETDRTRLNLAERIDHSGSSSNSQLVKSEATVQKHLRTPESPRSAVPIEQGKDKGQSSLPKHEPDKRFAPQALRNDVVATNSTSRETRGAAVTNSEAIANSGRGSRTRIEPSEAERRNHSGQLNSPEHSERSLGTVSATAYALPSRHASIRFDVWAPTFEKATSVKMELRSTYVIRGKVNGVCNFETVHTATRTPHVNIFVPREYRDLVRSGEKYNLVVTSIEEKRNSTVFAYDGRNRLVLRRGLLESAGLNRRKFGGEIVEVDVRNNSRPNEPIRRLFGKVEVSCGNVKLNAGVMEVRKGESLEVSKARYYEIGDFVRDFNATKPRVMDNVRMWSEGDKIGLEVKGQKFPFTEYRLSCKNLQVFLEARSGPGRRVLKFWFDGGNITPKLDEIGRIQKFESFSNGLFVYAGDADAMKVTRIDSGRTLKLKPERLDPHQLLEKITLVSKPDNVEGQFRFEADSSLSAYVSSRLAGERKRSSFRMEKGQIAEEICSCVLSKAGWREIRRHPSVKDQNIGHPSRPGPDSIQQFQATGEMYLFEFRWFANVQYAIRTAELEAKRRYREWYSVEEVKGAYIAVLDWDRRRSQGILHVKRVWSKGD